MLYLEYKCNCLLCEFNLYTRDSILYAGYIKMMRDELAGLMLMLQMTLDCLGSQSWSSSFVLCLERVSDTRSLVGLLLLGIVSIV